MTYEFFKTTLVSKFIKYLLANTAIPQYPFISDNDYMIKGCMYTYKDKILKCTGSGLFSGLHGGSEISTSYLTVQEDLYVNDPWNMKGTGIDGQHAEDYAQHLPTTQEELLAWMSVNKGSTSELMPLAVTDDLVSLQLYPPANFEIVNSYLPGIYKAGVTQTFNSNASYYDPDTHKHLGEYLRYLRGVYGLDLMPLYNCFNYNVTRDIVISKDSEIVVAQEYNKKYKVILVPIKFNKTYTVALENSTPVLMKAVFYNKNLIKDSRNQYYLYEDLLENVKIYNTMQFSAPITYSILNRDSNLFNYERYLYLAIQLPVNNNSSIVVLEGDYSRCSTNNISDVSFISAVGSTTEKLSSVMSSNLSLLQDNDGKQHPFSDKLIQYLCRNTIDTREMIDDNVKSVIKDLGNFYHGYDGQWTRYLRYVLYNRYMQLDNVEELEHTDILGYVDNDIEKALRRGYLKHE